MKLRIFTLILLLILTSVIMYAWVNREEIVSPCLPPLHYRIGEVDLRFGISQENFTALVTQSERMWENALGKNVFEYDPTASFTINLIYDERQSKTDQGLQLEKEISATKQTYDRLDGKLKADQKTFDSLMAQYTALSKTYEKDRADYNRQISDWNSTDRTSRKEYDALQKSGDALEKEREAINTLITKINDLADSTDKTVSAINNTADAINTRVTTHNNLFGENPEFNKGIFAMNRIDIYQFITQPDFLITLVHEMGHALHIEQHTGDPRSVMYYLMKDQSMNPIALTPQDITSANHTCKFDIQTPGEYFNIFLSSLSTPR